MESKFTKITNKNEWQNLLSKVLFKTFFHFWEWEEFLESQFKWLKFERYLWENQALLSLAKAGSKLTSHPFCEYGGPLPLVEKIDGKTFQRDLFEEFKTPFKISFHPKLMDYFEGIEFPEHQRETYFFENIDQKSISELSQYLDRNRHRLIEWAENLRKTGGEFQVTDPWIDGKNLQEKDIEVLHALYVKNLKRHKAIPYPYSFFKFVAENSKIILLKKKEKIIGGNLFLPYGKIIHSFLCGFDEPYRKAHTFIIWLAIINSKGDGYHNFDFGATRKDSSIKDFKERWGAKPYPIFELRNYSGGSDLRKSKLRAIYGLLPAFLIKKLSPHLIKYKL